MTTRTNLCCFSCFRTDDEKNNVDLRGNTEVKGYDVLYIEVPESDKVSFEDIRPAGHELTLCEYMALYRYVTEDKLPRPWYDCEYECYYILNGDTFVILQGWVPKKRAPWMRPPLRSIPREKINRIGKFEERLMFGPEKRYEVKEYVGVRASRQEHISGKARNDTLFKKLRNQNKPSTSFTKLFP